MRDEEQKTLNKKPYRIALSETDSIVPPRDLRKSVLNPDLEALCASGMLDPNDPDELDLIAYLYFARGCRQFERLIPENRRTGSWRRFYEQTAYRMEDLVEREYDFDVLEDYVLHGEDAVLRVLSFCRLTGWFSWVENDQYSTDNFACEQLPGYSDERALALCLELQREFGCYPPPHDPWHPSEANASLREGAYDIAERSRYGKKLYGAMRYVGQIARDEATTLGVEREGPEYWVLATLAFAQPDVWERLAWYPPDASWSDIENEAERCRRVLDEYDIDPARLEMLLRGVLAQGATSDPALVPALLEAAQSEVEWRYDFANPAELLKAAFRRPTDALRLALMRLGLLMMLESCFGATHKVPYRPGMFQERRDLEEVDLSKVDTSATESLRRMFNGCKSLRAVDLSPLDTSRVTTMSGLLYGCKSLASVSFEGIDTSHVTDLSYLFCDCESLRSIDLSEFDSSQVTKIDHMFMGCESLCEVDLSPLDTSRVTGMDGMFNFCESFKELPDLTCIDTSHVEDMDYLFHECTSIRTADLRGVDLRSVRSMWSMFQGCTSLESVDFSDLVAPELERVEDLFRDCASLVEVDFSHFKATKLCKLSQMFAGCTALQRVDLSGISVVEDARAFEAFDGCASLKSLTIPDSWPLSIERWHETLPEPTAACGMWWSRAEGRWMALEEIVERGHMADTFTNEPQV